MATVIDTLLDAFVSRLQNLDPPIEGATVEKRKQPGIRSELEPNPLITVSYVRGGYSPWSGEPDEAFECTYTIQVSYFVRDPGRVKNPEEIQFVLDQIQAAIFPYWTWIDTVVFDDPRVEVQSIDSDAKNSQGMLRQIFDNKNLMKNYQATHESFIITTIEPEVPA